MILYKRKSIFYSGVIWIVLDLLSLYEMIIHLGCKWLSVNPQKVTNGLHCTNFAYFLQAQCDGVKLTIFTHWIVHFLAFNIQVSQLTYIMFLNEICRDIRQSRLWKHFGSRSLLVKEIAIAESCLPEVFVSLFLQLKFQRVQSFDFQHKNPT